MKISVFGLGYVGTVTAACLARDGHQVIGVDVSKAKVDTLAAGRSPIVEPGLSDLLERAASRSELSATTDAREAVLHSVASLISVGTPPQPSGAPDLTYVERVCQHIGESIRDKGERHTVVLRSTAPPGTTDRCERILREAAGGVPVDVAFNPEFLREGSAIYDYDHPPYTVIGTENPRAEQHLRDIYASVEAPVLVVEPAVAELVKYVANAWHATKIVFANEVGRLARASGVDGREVMSVMAQDAKLNISAAYLKPGFAYGGSCLPKDVRAMIAHAQQHDIPVPLLSALPLSNAQQIDAAVDAVLAARPRRVAVLGLAFKNDTDDLRESPAVTLIKRLLGEGCEVRIYAPSVNKARLMGTNLAYIAEHLPHFANLLVESMDGLVPWSDVAVVTHVDGEFREALLQPADGTRIVDLAGLFAQPPDHPDYHGIAW